MHILFVLTLGSHGQILKVQTLSSAIVKGGVNVLRALLYKVQDSPVNLRVKANKIGHYKEILQTTQSTTGN